MCSDEAPICFTAALAVASSGRGAFAQQPPSRHRREGHGALQLGIIVAAGPLQRIRPGMVEDIFAIGMAFQIQRHQPVVAAAGEQGCQPVSAAAEPDSSSAAKNS